MSQRQLTEERLKFIKEVKKNVLKYLEDQYDIAFNALAAYEPGAIMDSDSEIRKMREWEAIKLRDRVSELNRHVAVIKQMYPDA
jgi:hypothetical protein